MILRLVCTLFVLLVVTVTLWAKFLYALLATICWEPYAIVDFYSNNDVRYKFRPVWVTLTRGIEHA
jgi:hypothetical protein